MGAVRHQRAVLAGFTLDRLGFDNRRLYLEIHAVLDRDLYRRPDGDRPGALRGGRRRRCDWAAAVRAHYLSAARHALFRQHAVVDDLLSRRFRDAVPYHQWRPGVDNLYFGEPRDPQRL